MDLRPLLDFVFPPQCAGCNALGDGLCNACTPRAPALRVRFPTLSVTAVGAYAGTLRAAVLALKDGRRDVAQALGRIAAPLIAGETLLAPVPTTARRRRVRGVDGVALAAQRAAELAGARVLVALDQRAGDAQRGRSRAQRLAAQGRFACTNPSVAGRHVTLFDDVCTTGATLRDCADAIRAAGGVVKDAVVIAVANEPQPWREPIAY